MASTLPCLLAARPNAHRRPLSFLILGAPCVGKSSFVNTVAGSTVFEEHCFGESSAPRIQEKIVKANNGRVLFIESRLWPSVTSPTSPDIAKAATNLRNRLLKSYPVDSALVFLSAPSSTLSKPAQEEALTHQLLSLLHLEDALGSSFWRIAVFVLVDREAKVEEDAACGDSLLSSAIRRALGSSSPPSFRCVRWSPSSAAAQLATDLTSAVASIMQQQVPFFPPSLHEIAAARSAAAAASPATSAAADEFADLPLIADCNVAALSATGSEWIRPLGAVAAPAPAAPAPVAVTIPLTCAAVSAAAEPSHALPSLAIVPAFASLSLSLAAARLPLPAFRPQSASLARARPSNIPTSLPPAMSTAAAVTPAASALHPVSSNTSSSFQKALNAPLPVRAASQLISSLPLALPPSIRLSSLPRAPSNCSAFPDFSGLLGVNRGQNHPGSGAAGCGVALVWFRNDLRTHDHQPLAMAHSNAAAVVPVYCFDPRDYGKSSSGFDRTGPYRASFLLQCVSDLRQALRQRGSDLIVRVGRPDRVLADLARQAVAGMPPGLRSCRLFAHKEVTREEGEAEAAVQAALKEEGVESSFSWGSTLYHLEDLPFSLSKMPPHYGAFRDAIKGVKVRASEDLPEELKRLPANAGIKPGDIPTLQALGLSSPALKPGQPILVGGESEALRKLNSLISSMLPQPSALSASLTTASSGCSMIGATFSSKISPWLSMGCLSSRSLFQQLAGRKPGGGNQQLVTAQGVKGFEPLVHELLWRDFFRFITLKYTEAGTKPVPSAAPVMAA